MTLRVWASALLTTATALLAISHPPLGAIEVPSAGNGTASTAPLSLEGTLWRLDAYRSAETLTRPLPHTRLTAQLQDQAWAGFDGCQPFTARYQLAPDRHITVEPPDEPQTASPPADAETCDPLVTEQAQDYVTALAEATQVEIRAHQLWLLDGAGEVVAVFAAVEPIWGNWQVTVVSDPENPWAATHGNPEDEERELEAEAADRAEGIGAITAQFDAEGNLTGNTGCNRYGGQYTLAGDRFQATNLVQTTAACLDPDLNQREAQFVSRLATAATQIQFEGSDRFLLVNNAGEPLLAFAREVIQASLVGIPWQLTALHQDGALQPVVSDAPASAELSWLTYGDSGSRQLTGTTGCNSYSAEYRIQGDRLQITPLALTRMTCNYLPGLMAQEAAFLEALETAVSYRFQGDTLELLDAAGTAIAQFRRPF